VHQNLLAKAVQHPRAIPFLEWAEREGLLLEAQKKFQRFPYMVTGAPGPDLVAGAARAGDLETVRWLMERGWRWYKARALGFAIFGGHMEILTWAKEAGLLPLEEERGDSMNTFQEIYSYMPDQNIPLEVFTWMAENNFPLSLRVCGEGAACHGHVEVLQWLWEREEGEEWYEKWIGIEKEKEGKGEGEGEGKGEEGEEIEEGEGEEEVEEEEEEEEGMEDILQRIVFEGIPHVSVLEWVWKTFPEFLPSDPDFCFRACEMGKLEAVKFLRSKGCPILEEAFIEAAIERHLEVVTWAMEEEGWRGSTGVCEEAARRGDLEFLKWARGRGCPWDERVYKRAGERGRRDILEWATEEGCPWSESVVRHVVGGRKAHVVDFLDWVWESGLYMDSEKLLSIVLESGEKKALDWLEKKGREKGASEYTARKEGTTK
jgi:hypothetical protein